MKTRFFLLLTVFVLNCVHVFAQSENTMIQKGDINGDGIIDISDVVELVNYVLKGKPMVEIGEIGESPSVISDGSSAMISFTTNAPSTISLINSNGEGWSASVSSTDETSHTIIITNEADVPVAGTIPANSIKVIATPTNTEEYKASDEISVQPNDIQLNALEIATVITSPTFISGLTYNGNPQSLVEPGTATNGTMQYVMNTTNTQPTDGWTTDIPEGTNAGIYYVWYKAVGSEGVVDSEVEEPVMVEIAQANPILKVENPTSTTIDDGSNTTITVTSNVAGKLTITSPDGSGWSATSSSVSIAETTHTITINYLTSTTTDGSITAGDIIATFTPTDTDNYNTLTGLDILKQNITLNAIKAQPRAWLDSNNLRRTRGNVLDHISWSNASVDPGVTTSGTYITLTKGTVTAYYNLEPASTTLHLENIRNPKITYDGYSSYISVGEIQNGVATVSVVGGNKIEGGLCKIKVFDGETFVTTLELRVNRDISNVNVTTSSTYTHFIGTENKGNISFADRVKFRALDVENKNTRVTIKATYGGKSAATTEAYTVSPANT